MARRVIRFQWHSWDVTAQVAPENGGWLVEGIKVCPSNIHGLGDRAKQMRRACTLRPDEYGFDEAAEQALETRAAEVAQDTRPAASSIYSRWA